MARVLFIVADVDFLIVTVYSFVSASWRCITCDQRCQIVQSLALPRSILLAAIFVPYVPHTLAHIIRFQVGAAHHRCNVSITARKTPTTDIQFCRSSFQHILLTSGAPTSQKTQNLKTPTNSITTASQSACNLLTPPADSRRAARRRGLLSFSRSDVVIVGISVHTIAAPTFEQSRIAALAGMESAVTN